MEAKELLLHIVKGIVSNPDGVKLEERMDTDEKGEAIVFTIVTDREDVGVCIGNKGSTAEAIRRVVGLVGFKQTGKRVFVKIDTPNHGKSRYDY